jgi:hypothetical protein
MITRCAIDSEPCARCLRETGRIVRHTWSGLVDVDALRQPAAPDYAGEDQLVYCSFICARQAGVKVVRAISPEEVHGGHLCAYGPCKNLVGVA